MAFLFEKLDVYQKALNFADAISQITEGFLKGHYYLADQLNRASLSISANIAEGNGRYHKADRANFFTIARGSAFECVPLLEISRRKNLVSEERFTILRDQIEAISKMLSGLIER